MPSANLHTREDWLQARASGIGASESAIVLGVSPYKTPFGLWAEKTGLADPSDESEAMRIGRAMEPVIAQLYQEATGREVADPGDYSIERHPQAPYLFATVDRLVIDCARGVGICELKNAGAYKAHEWDDGAPLAYQVQVQHQMAVCGVQWASVAVLIGGNKFRWCDVERNDRFISAMLPRLAEFWRLVETRTPPPVDGDESTTRALAALYPTDDGESVMLPERAARWDRWLADLAAKRKRIEAIEAKLKNRLRAKIGSAQYGVLPGGGRWKWATTERKAYTVEAKTTRELRRVK